MKRRVLGVAVVIAALVSACTGTETAAPRRRNATVDSAALVNGNFAAGGGGWSENGVALGAGCNGSGGDPSLGVWRKNAIAFGFRRSTVSQTVVIPNPSTVVLKIDGAVRDDQRDATFVVELKSKAQTASTGSQTGAALVATQTFTLSVVTVTPNESVTVSATGSSSKFWAGCYGPIISNASFVVSPNASPIVIVGPTTTVAVTSTSAAPTSTIATPTSSSPSTTTVPTTTVPTTIVSTTNVPTTLPTATVAPPKPVAAFAVPQCTVISSANCSNTYWAPDTRMSEVVQGKSIKGVNFSGATMQEVNLSGVKFPNSDFHQADLSGAQADGSSFVTGNFVDTNLSGVNIGAAFEQMALKNERGPSSRFAPTADFSGADFSYARMKSAQLQGGNFSRAVFTGTDLSHANFFGANLDGADLRMAELTGVRSGLILGRPILPREWSLESGYLVGPGADLSVESARTYIEADRELLAIGPNVQSLPGATCPVIWLKSSRPLFGQQVRGYGSLAGTNFRSRNLEGVNFSGLDLRGAKFEGSPLSGAIFSGANLDAVDFSNANMTRVALDYATLNNTDFSNARWRDISSGCTTLLPTSAAASFPEGWKLDTSESKVVAKRLIRGRLESVDAIVRHGLILGDTANLGGANLIGLNLRRIELSRANLSDVRSTSIGEYFVDSQYRPRLSMNLPRNWGVVNGILVGPEANLKFANLSNVDLRYFSDLSNVSLEGAFSMENLRVETPLPEGWAVTAGRLVGPGVDLSRANLGSGNLTDVQLDGADLSGADFSRTTMNGARGENIVVDRGTRFPSGWRVINGILFGPTANLDGVSQDFGGGIDGVNPFRGVDLTGASLKQVELKGMKSSPQLPASWKVVDGFLVGPTARVDYSQIRNTAAIAQENLPVGFIKTSDGIIGPNMTLSNFKPRELSNVDISGSQLNGADLRSTRMTNVRGEDLIFRDVTFPLGWRYVTKPGGGVLVGPSANLSKMDLSLSNLSGVDLRGADLSNSRGRFITVNDRTLLPRGWKILAGTLFGPTADLSDANVSGLDLSELDLAGAILDGARGTDIRREPRALPSRWRVIRGNLVGPTANLICTSLDKGELPGGIASTARVSSDINPRLFDERVPQHMPC